MLAVILHNQISWWVPCIDTLETFRQEQLTASVRILLQNGQRQILKQMLYKNNVKQEQTKQI